MIATTTPSARQAKYAETALARECAEVAATAPGNRNAALNRSSFNVGQLIGNGLDAARAESALLTAALACGLSEIEARATITSGLASGAASPRQPNGPRESATPRPKATARSTAALKAAKAAGGNGAIYATPEAAGRATAKRIGGRFTRAWPYPGGDYAVVRIDLPEGDEATGKRKKQFRPVTRNGHGWRIGDPEGPLPLYCGGGAEALDDDGGAVCVVEGEKCADAAASIGLPAVTSPHGSGSASRANWQPLAGRDVIVLPDNDEAGRKYAEDVAAILSRLGAKVKIVPLPDVPPGGDICEFIADGAGINATEPDDLREAVLYWADHLEYWTPAADTPPADTETTATTAPASKPAAVTFRAKLTNLATVKPQPIRWLWPKRIARGKLTLIFGDPGQGKSLLTLDLAATVSAGRPWPDGAPSDGPGGVVLISGEDDAADTIRPRLDAAGADVSRITLLTGVVATEGDTSRESAFTLSDTEALVDAISRTPDCAAVVIDPVSCYLGSADGHRNDEVRALLAKLAAVASDRAVSIVAVTHLRKSAEGGALARSMGSLAFIAAARAAYVVCRDPEDESRQRRLFLPAKNNVGNDRDGLAFDIVESRDGLPMIAWYPDPVYTSADDALATRREPPGPKPDKTDEAAEWLEGILANGPMAADDVKALAKRDGIAEKTLNRAKKKLEIEASKTGMGGGWTWTLPEDGQVKTSAEDGQDTELL